MSKTWWLSFAGDEGFRGGVVVDGNNFLHAVKRAHRLGINPGGEVRGLEIPNQGPLPMNTLLSKEDINLFDKAMKWPL